MPSLSTFFKMKVPYCCGDCKHWDLFPWPCPTKNWEFSQEIRACLWLLLDWSFCPFSFTTPILLLGSHWSYPLKIWKHARKWRGFSFFLVCFAGYDFIYSKSWKTNKQWKCSLLPQLCLHVSQSNVSWGFPVWLGYLFSIKSWALRAPIYTCQTSVPIHTI